MGDGVIIFTTGWRSLRVAFRRANPDMRVLDGPNPEEAQSNTDEAQYTALRYSLQPWFGGLVSVDRAMMRYVVPKCQRATYSTLSPARSTMSMISLFHWHPHDRQCASALESKIEFKNDQEDFPCSSSSNCPPGRSPFSISCSACTGSSQLHNPNVSTTVSNDPGAILCTCRNAGPNRVSSSPCGSSLSCVHRF
jgi:hypothetical protein